MPVEDILARIRANGNITAEDALEVRRSVYSDDGTINPLEIEGLFVIDEAAQTADPAWSALFVEAGTDFIVRQERP